MIAHQTVGVAQPVEAVNHLMEGFEESEAIFVVQEDFLPRVAATCHMIERTRILDSQRSCHEDSLAQRLFICKT